jgi:hypothetical protein
MHVDMYIVVKVRTQIILVQPPERLAGLLAGEGLEPLRAARVCVHLADD